MITKEILELINHKLKSVIIYLVIIGLAFFVLASAVLFYPDVLQYLFVIGFFLVAFLAFLIAVKISHIKSIFDKALLIYKKLRLRK